MMDMKMLRPNAWVCWQTLDGGGWGLIDADLESKTLNRATHKYYELAQFTRHVRPGMQILDTDSRNVISAIDQKMHKLVIVAANWDGKQNITLDLSAFSKISVDGTGVRSWLTDREGGNLYASYNGLKLEDGGISTLVDNGTVQTFEIDGVHL